MRSTYGKEDVEILLKDITGLVKPQSTEEREKLIQSGRHYCEMLPIEYSPSERYMQAYGAALTLNAADTASAVGLLADKIMQERGKEVVLVSLARAGIPIGILVKRYLRWKYSVEVPHLAISIIRGKGIDQNAMRYILKRHRAENLLFVDGWIGKGAILRELEQDVADFPGVSPELAVAADPANITRLCGTHEDILIPSSCLNSTVSGLVSRTFLREDIIGRGDFHGAVYYGELEGEDLSLAFLAAIEEKFSLSNESKPDSGGRNGMEEVDRIAEHLGIGDINYIKPGIGETTRVLLRRVPWKVLISEKYRAAPVLDHILKLAKEKSVAVEFYPLENYKACGIIKRMADV